MGFVLFYYTLFVMLASILASATCLSAYLVSHRREMMFAVFGFLFYFFDVAWVLQDDFALLGDLQVVGVFVIVRSLVSVVTGGGCLMAFWLLLCDYLGGTNRALRVVPGVVYVLGSIAALTLLPDGNVQRFVFYTTRAMLLFWMLLYVGFRYFSSKDEVERNRLRRHRWLYVLVWVVGLLMVLEDASFFLVCEPNSIVMWPRTFVPERNFMENVLMLSLAFFACRCRCVSSARRCTAARCRTRASARTSWCTASVTSCPSASRRCCTSCCWATTTRTSRPPCTWP